MSRDAAVVALAEAIDLGDLGTRIAPKALEWLEANGWTLAPAASETSLDGLPTADELAQALTECAPARPGIYAEAEAILHELRKNRAHVVEPEEGWADDD